MEDNNIDQHMSVHIDTGWHGKGEYLLSLKENTKWFASYNSTNCDYITDSLNTGKLTITHFDSAKRIVSGRFHFTAVIEQGDCEKDTIRVTEGRFDIQD